MFTHISSTQCNHPHCPHTFPIHVVNDQLHLCIHPHSDDVKSSDSTVDMVFRLKLFTPKIFFRMWKQPVIRRGEILNVGRMCQHIPAPLLHQTVHIMMAMLHCPVAKCSSSSGCLWWRAGLTLFCKCTIILATDRCTNWQRMVKHKLHFRWRT